MIFLSERCRIFTMETVILKESRSSGADALGMSAGIAQLVKSSVFLLCVECVETEALLWSNLCVHYEYVSVSFANKKLIG